MIGGRYAWGIRHTRRKEKYMHDLVRRQKERDHFVYLGIEEG